MAARPKREVVIDGDLAIVPLTRGKLCVIDAEDIPKLMRKSWRARWCKETQSYQAYSTSRVGEKETAFYLSRVVMGAEAGDSRLVDHINHDTLDNRKSNLRFVSHKENAQNRRTRKDNLSGHRGVGVYQGKWRSRIWVNGKLVDVYKGPDKEAAIAARREAELRHFGEYACAEGL